MVGRLTMELDASKKALRLLPSLRATPRDRKEAAVAYKVANLV